MCPSISFVLIRDEQQRISLAATPAKSWAWLRSLTSSNAAARSPSTSGTSCAGVGRMSSGASQPLKPERNNHMLTTLTSRGSSVSRPRKPAIELPRYVNCVRVKGRPYYYFHPGRGTKCAGKPIRLLDDPRLPEWWVAYRKAAGDPEPRANPKSFASLITGLPREWSDAITDGVMSVIQGKTGKRVWVPVRRELRKLLDEIPKRAVTILTSTEGTPWTTQLQPSFVLAESCSHSTGSWPSRECRSGRTPPEPRLQNRLQNLPDTL